MVITTITIVATGLPSSIIGAIITFRKIIKMKIQRKAFAQLLWCEGLAKVSQSK